MGRFQTVHNPCTISSLPPGGILKLESQQSYVCVGVCVFVFQPMLVPMGDFSQPINNTPNVSSYLGV